jgi:flavin-binding protein dodecin
MSERSVLCLKSAFDLNGEANRARKRQNRATIAADVRRFAHVINRVLGTHKGLSLGNAGPLTFGPIMLLTSERARSGADADQSQENSMAKQQRRQISPQDDTEQQADTVYKIVEVVGVSEKSWEDAGRNAVETAAGSLRDLRVAEVTKMDMKLENGKVAAFRTRVSLSFKYGA